MNSTKKIKSDLSSGFFQDHIQYLAPNELRPIEDAEVIATLFTDILPKKGIDYKHVVQSSGETYPCSINFDKDSGFQIQSEHAVNEGDTIYFEFLSQTYCFFTNHQGELPSQIYTISRRSWKRYHLNELDYTAKVKHLDVVLSGKVIDIGLSGLSISCENKSLPLFEQIEVTIEGENYLAEIVNIKNDDNQYCAHIHENDVQRYRDNFYSPTVKKHYYQSKCIDPKTSEEELKNIFNKAVIYQEYDAALLDEDENSKTYIEYDKEESISSLSKYRLNEKTCLLHTLVLSEGYKDRLPISLFEDITNDVITSVTRYFYGYWPTKSRVLDRGYTDFVQNNTNKDNSFYKQIAIYNFKTRPIDSSIKRLKNPLAQQIPEIKKLFSDNYGDIFLDAYELEEKLNNPDNVYVLEHDNEIIAASFCIETDSRLKSFGVGNQIWIASNKDLDKQEYDCFINEYCGYFFNKGKENFFINLNDFQSSLVGHVDLTHYIKEINFWISSVSLTKDFINHLTLLDYQLNLISKNKNIISKSFVKFFKSTPNKHIRRKAVRCANKDLKKDIKFNLELSDSSSLEVKLTSFDTYGASFDCPLNMTFNKGDIFKATLKIKNEYSLDVDCEIRYFQSKVVRHFENQMNTVGVQFSYKKYDDAIPVVEYCFRKNNPEIDEYNHTCYKGLIDLIDKSGYFDYYESGKKSIFKNQSEITYTHLNKLAPDLARVTVLKPEDSIIGTHAFYRKTEKMWQLHQLAVDEGVALYKKHIPTKLILCGSFEYLCLDPTVKYFITNFSDKAAIAKTYFDVRNHHENSSEYAYISFQAFLIDTSKPKIAQSGYTVTLASEEEVEKLSGYLETMIPRIEYDAFDFKDLKQTQFNDVWSKREHSREREILVLKNKKNEIIHFAVVDLSPIGLNVIGFTDYARIFTVPWCGYSEGEESYTILIEHLKEYYLSKERIQFYLEVNDTATEYMSNVEGLSLGKNWKLIAEKNTFMTALQYFINRFSRLEKRLNRTAAK